MKLFSPIKNKIRRKRKKKSNTHTHRQAAAAQHLLEDKQRPISRTINWQIVNILCVANSVSGTKKWSVLFHSRLFVLLTSIDRACSLVVVLLLLTEKKIISSNFDSFSFTQFCQFSILFVNWCFFPSHSYYVARKWATPQLNSVSKWKLKSVFIIEQSYFLSNTRRDTKTHTPFSYQQLIDTKPKTQTPNICHSKLIYKFFGHVLNN